MARHFRQADQLPEGTAPERVTREQARAVGWDGRELIAGQYYPQAALAAKKCHGDESEALSEATVGFAQALEKNDPKLCCTVAQAASSRANGAVLELERRESTRTETEQAQYEVLAEIRGKLGVELG